LNQIVTEMPGALYSRCTPLHARRGGGTVFGDRGSERTVGLPRRVFQACLPISRS
jgi:hypothetical protein